MAGFYAGRPDFYYGIAFNAEPGDTVTIPIWNEFTSLVRSMSALFRGKQYELAQVMAAQPSVVIRDPSETLNPDNTTGPYYGELVPYRPTVFLGQWANVGGGTPPSGQTNLLNLDYWQDPIDPSFESYTVGTKPPFMDAVTVNPLVTTSSPHTGSKCVSWADSTAADAFRYLSWPIRCIPGRQYTPSGWVLQSANLGMALGVGNQPATIDLFGRTQSSGWGTPSPVGVNWGTPVGGVAADYSVIPGFGQILQSSTNVSRIVPPTTVSPQFPDINAAVYINPQVTAAGGSITAGLCARITSSASNCYIGGIIFNTDGSLSATIIKRVTSAETTLSTVTLPYTFTPGIRYGVRINVQRAQIAVTVWPETIAEPAAQLTILDNAVPGSASNAVVGCYTRTATGNTNGSFNIQFSNLNAAGVELGTATSTTGAYVQLSNTFTATQPEHTMVLYPTAGTTATINLDDIQQDQAATVQTRCTTGPTIYPIMQNYGERFTRSYDETGFEGLCTIPCVDAYAALAASTIGVEYQEALDATAPTFSWPLNDSGNGTSFGEVVQGGPSLVARNGTAAALTGQLTPGTQFNIPGYPNQTGVQISGNTDTFAGVSLVASGLQGIQQNGGSVALTIAFWASWLNNRAADQALVGLGNKNTSGFYIYQDTGGGIGVQLNNGGTVSAIQTSAHIWADGRPHMVVVRLSGANLVSGNIFVDGVQDSLLGFNAMGTPNYNVNQLAIAAGTISAPGTGSGINGTYAQVHIWDRVLTNAEIANLYAASQGFAGETSGERIARHLALGGYNGPTRIDTGEATMGPPSYSPTIDLATDTGNTTAAENGDFWIAPDGAVVFQDRNARYLQTTPKWFFGENEAGGESPYEQGIVFDDDPTYIFADIEVQRPAGINAIGGLPLDIAAAQRLYFGRSQSITVDLADDEQTQDLANWTFYTHNRPQTRVAQLSLNPAANPDLWPVVLGTEIGDRVRVTKRSPAANGGTGIVVTADYFIESINHDSIDMDAGTWITTYTMSPVGSATSGNGQTVQPWILQDATYGVLSSTTVLAY
jgi:hypothetical protein